MSLPPGLDRDPEIVRLLEPDGTATGCARYAMPPVADLLQHYRSMVLGRRLDDAPKSRRWKVRARVGERVRWYELPEETH